MHRTYANIKFEYVYSISVLTPTVAPPPGVQSHYTLLALCISILNVSCCFTS